MTPTLHLGDMVKIKETDVSFNNANVFVKDPTVPLNVANKQYVDIADEEVRALILASATTYTTSRTEYYDLLGQRQTVQSTLATQIENLYQYFFDQSRTDAVIISTTLNVLNVGGCCLWLDAADSSSVITSGPYVTGWNDKSTREYNFTQTNSAKRPTYLNNTLNGNSVISFTNSNQTYLGGPTGFNIGPNSYSLFSVCKFNNNYSNGGIFNRALFGGASGRIIMLQEGTEYHIGLNRGYLSEMNASAQIGVAGQYRILEVIINRVQGHDEIYQNGIKLTEISYGSDINSTYSEADNYNMIVGGYNNGSGGINPPNEYYYLDGAIAEIIAFSNPYDMTNSTRQEIEGYLAKKWGIQSLLPNDHPFKN